MLLLVSSVLLAGCAAPPPPKVWVRTDGQSTKENPALMQQFELDKTICLGEAQKANLSAGTNYYGGFAGVAEQMRRNEATVSVAQGCMAQRGYALVEQDRALEVSASFAATEAQRKKAAAALVDPRNKR